MRPREREIGHSSTACLSGKVSGGDAIVPPPFAKMSVVHNFKAQATMEEEMKKLFLLFILCMVSMLAFAQADSPSPSDNDAPAPGDVSFMPPSWDFGQIAVGIDYNKVFTLTNNRGSSITITRISASPAPPFSVVGTTCGGILQGNGASCNITVQAKANEPGQKTGTLEVQCTGAPGCPFTAAVMATAVHDVTLTPTSYNFGVVQVGDSSSASLTLTNNEPIPLSISEIEADPNPPFSIESKTCRATLPALSSCSITVGFTPNVVGPASGNLRVMDNAVEVSSQSLESSLMGDGIKICPLCPPTQ